MVASVGTAAEEPGVTMQDVLDHERQLERRVVTLARVRASYPQQLSGAFGVMFVQQPRDWDCATVCDFKGLLVQAEPGIAGGQFGVGMARLVGEKRRHERFVSEVYMGFALKGVLLRTWGDATLDPADQTFLGVEGAYTVTRVNFSLGLFRHVSRGVAERDWLATFGIGWGF